jgi:hypothetical protein
VPPPPSMPRLRGVDQKGRNAPLFCSNYFMTVQPLLHDISPRLEFALLADEKVDESDLFVWALITGHFDSDPPYPFESGPPF